MLQEVSSFDSSRFNSLPDIVVADAEMRAGDRLSTALAALGPVFVRHKMCDKWGISLLHNHWPAEPEELPIQDAQRTDSPKEFETRPRRAFAGKIWPSVLAMRAGSGSELEPIEFSTDQHVREANDALTSEFVRDFCSTLAANDLGGMFGLIAPQGVSSPELEFVEFNYAGRVSILKEAVVAEGERTSLIETSWHLVPDEVAGTCTKSCFAKCTISGGSHSKSHSPVHAPS